MKLEKETRNQGANTRPYQPKRQRRSIKLDRVNPQDFARIKMRFFCDDCSHYSPSQKICTMGYIPQHTVDAQLEQYNRTGMMAFCRFIEID